jgi:hypothetical protein
VPEVENYITKLENENKYHISKIKSMYKDIEEARRHPTWRWDSNGNTVMMPAAEFDKLEAENAALRLLIEWAEECDFGYDNFPEEYERYKDEIKDIGYIEGMIHIAKRVLSEKKGDR